MKRHLAVAGFLLAFAGASFAQSQPAPRAIGGDPPALRLMSNDQFSGFLKRLDADALSWKARLRTVRINTLGLSQPDARELQRSYEFCLQAIENTRADLQTLSQKQALKQNFMLLMDLNGLARSLDRLSSDLANANASESTAAARNSLAWAREVLRIDQALSVYMGEFQHHVLAYAGLVDIALERMESSAEQRQTPN